MEQIRPRWRAFILAFGLAVAASAATAPTAQAYPWDPSAVVVASVGTCGPSVSSGWGWYETSYGEKGWVTWSPTGGSYFTFQLRSLPKGGGHTVKISWGVSNCSKSVTRGIARPAYGNNIPLGYLG